MNFTVAVVLPAAGCGARMDLGTPKQFAYLGNKPLLCHALDVFQKISWVKGVVVVLPGPTHPNRKFLSRWGGAKVIYVAGGVTRHSSIRNGLKALSSSPPDVVIIHDGVRPFIDERTVNECATTAWIHGACGMTRPLVSTVLVPDEEQFLSRSLDRSSHVSSEMPQAFRYDVICEAYERCSEHDLEYGTECLHLVLKYCKVKAKLIAGPETLWKVTYKKDLYAAKYVLQEQSASRVNKINIWAESVAAATAIRQCVSVIEVDGYCVTHSELWEKIDVTITNQLIMPVVMVTGKGDFTQSVMNLLKRSDQQPFVSQILLILLVCFSSLDVFEIQKWISDVATSKSLSIRVIISQCQNAIQPIIENEEKLVRVVKDVLSLDGNVLSAQILVA